MRLGPPRYGRLYGFLLRGASSLALRAVVFILALASERASAAILYGGTTTAGHAKGVTIVRIEDRQRFVILTLSGPLTGSPPCAAKHPNVIVIGNGNQSPDAQKARNAVAMGKALEVWGGGICRSVPYYETLSGFQAVDGTDLLSPTFAAPSSSDPAK
jgi:hypothetical protein